MDIALPAGTSRTITVATLAVFVLGVSLSFSTWRNLRQQQAFFREHTLLTARSIAMGIEINLRRELRMPAVLDPTGSAILLHRTIAKDLLQDYSKRTDAKFIGLFSPQGHIVLSSHADPKSLQEQLPKIVWERIGDTGEWSGELNFEGQPILVLGRLSHLPMRIINYRGQLQSDDGQPFLLIGMDMTHYLGAFDKYKRTAILQTGYILAVTVLFWIFLLSLMQRKEEGQRLQRLESFNARLLDNMPDGLLTLSAEGQVIAANPAAQRLMAGILLLGQPLDHVFAALGLQTGQLRDQDWTLCQTSGKNLEILQVPLRDGSGQSLLLIRDRTELAGLERELHRTEKLAAIGRMAAGVAHEIRNPLSALRGFAQFFSKKLAGREPEELYARTMVQEADRLNRVVTDLLFLARPRPLHVDLVPLADIFQDVHTLLHMDVQAKNAQLTAHFLTEAVMSDPDALKQALINLIVNSVSALPEAGGLIAVESQSDQDGVWVRVRDNGRGLSEEEREHALEPFYTTRDKGTGLGLTIVHTIMQEHGGRVILENNSQAGATVSLFFPDNRVETHDEPDHPYS